MFRLAAVLALILASPAAAVADCGTYTLDARPPGERLATIEGDRVLTIADQYEGESVYDLTSSGTGIDFMTGQRRGGGETVEVLEHKGDLIVDMMIYTPFCGRVTAR